ncbi:phosphopantetheine-binding protein [Legionella cincinnatiensis]|uniref:Acyl carrier protein n=1 Tax=Legionella cincinnatiensis TaxID=28085 RepID=A0A378IPY1_9GAMM|nr:phosphopantetheine-binding protein [Legionella cincinnatiensis]KTC93467.1 Acyl carrier protein [Legionella cincinnatiensis]STX36531.1 Acyl carrier protein [Legionella cincinnatiensis]
MNQQIQERVIQLIAKNQKIPPESIQLNQSVEELCETSLDLVSLLFALEDEFDINLLDDAEVSKTVRDIILGIEELLNVQQSTETSAA